MPSRPSPRLISVVIPVLNDAETLADQLEALRGQDYTGDWELVIVDNGSTDASCEIAERWVGQFPRAQVVRAADRRSPGHARNAGASRSSGDFLAFTDADDAAQPGWLTALAEAAPLGDLVAGSVVVDGLNDERSLGWHVVPPRERSLREDRFLSYASGANLGIWAEVFERLGGFEEDAIAGEDKEFSWRAQMTSFRLVWAPDAVVRYRLRDQVSELARQHYRYGTTGPRLYRLFRDSGMPRRRPTKALMTWSWILLTWPAAAWSERFRGRWALEAALACGRVTSSMRNRVLFL
jgi:glycosyltransferase involved in cell wall biosynthesis